MGFPDRFLWGTGTSSYQIEGAVQADGRGESIWDRFCRIPGRVHNGENGDLACDHYHRWEQDLDLMAELGVRAYRFSVAWPRVLPLGEGQANLAGIDFYRRLTEGLLKRNIRPMVTLYHWDLPQALEEHGGWLARETAAQFAEYSHVVVRALGDLVSDWVTLNEPWVSAMLGYAWGTHAPGIAGGTRSGLTAAHHLLLGHGLAMEAIRAVARPGHRAGIVLNLGHIYPVSDSPQDRAAAARVDGANHRWYLDPVLRGSYPADVRMAYEAELGSLTFIRPGDEDRIGAPTDFLGINYYSVGRVHAKEEGEIGWAPPQGPVTAMNWEIWPEGLGDLLHRLKREYGEIPLLITENGAAFDDTVGPNGEVDDPDRVRFLAQHLAAAESALREGVNLQGYFVWSLLDNFEWAEGYARRFGLTHVDYQTQRRTPKASWHFYREVIRLGGLPTGSTDGG